MSTKIRARVKRIELETKQVSWDFSSGDHSHLVKEQSQPSVAAVTTQLAAMSSAPVKQSTPI